MPRETRYYKRVPSECTTTYGVLGTVRPWRAAVPLFAIALGLGIGSSSAAPKKPFERHQPFFPLDLVWTHVLAEPVVDGPAMDGDRVFVAARGGQVHALDLLTGREAWAISRAAVSPLAAGDGLLFVHIDGAIAAHASVDGDMKWSIPLEEPLSAPITWDHGWLLLPTAGGDLLALRAADGQQVWRQPLGSPVRGRPAGNAGSELFVALDDGRIVALDLATGREIWSRALGGKLSDPAAIAGRVYVGSTSNRFYALDADSGRIDWQWRTGGDVAGPTAADKDRVYFASLDNVLRAVARGNGNQAWRKDLPTRPATGPVVADRTVIVAGIAPELHGFGALDGKAAGQYVAAGEFAGAPLFRVAAPAPEPAVIVVSRDGSVSALRPHPLLPIEDPILVPAPFDRPPFGLGGDPPLVPLPALPGRPLRPGA